VTPTLGAASFRHLLRHPLQLALVLTGLALGVGTIVAVDIATSSARRALELSLAAVNGAATHQIAGGPRGIDEALYVRLRRASVAPGESRPLYAPVLDGYVTIGEQTLELLGVDPFASAELARDSGASTPGPTRDLGLSELRRWLGDAGTVLMSARTARELGVAPGQEFPITVDGVPHRAVLLGLLSGTDAGFDGLVFTDIAQAQEWLGALGRLTRIDVRLPQGAQGTALLARLRAQLPAELELRATQGSARETFAMTDAFTTNLKAMSLLALLVGLLLIYGAVSFAIVQRRPTIAVLRAVGATRRQVLGTVLAEAALLGIVGAACGVLLGVVIGRGLVQLVSQTINDLYFVVAVRTVTVPASALVQALAAGLGTALAAALVPAVEVAASPPQLGLMRSALENRAAFAARALAVLGALLAGAAGLTVVASQRSLFAGFGALFLLLVGVAALTPAALRVLAQAAAHLARANPVVRLGLGGVATSLSRTGVAVAALGMALSAMIGVAIMVESFRESLREWLVQRLRADVYVSAPGPTQSPERRLEPEVIRALLAVPAVRAHSENRWVTVSSPQGPTDLNAVKLVPESRGAFTFTGGDPGQVWAQFARGAIFVSEPLAWRLRLRPGDALTLTTAHGPEPFVVAEVYREYGNDHGEVLMDLAVYRRLWRDEEVSGLGIYLAPGVTAARAIGELRRAAGARQALLIRSNADIRELSLRIFDRTFVITRVLYWLAAGVAALGLLSALIAWELERAHELAVLRALGLTRAGTFVLVIAQTLFMGLVALLAAIPAGFLTALVLTDVINRRAFGWQIDLHLSGRQFTDAACLALAASAAAALYPAWRSARAALAAALREE